MPHALSLRLALTAPALVLAATAAPAPAQTRLEAVTLSTAGMALLSARAPLGGEALRIDVPRARIDSFLQSLWVMDPSGAVPRLSLPGPGIVSDTFAALPLTPADIGDRARLLQAMAGASIIAARGGQSWEGAVMGVSAQPCGTEGRTCPHLLLGAADGVLHSLPLEPELTVRLADAADRDAVSRAVGALRAGGESGPVAVTLETSLPDPREIGLFWLEQAPVWRTAWRAIDGPEGLQLTGWAVVENATGRDWENVELTLATGAIRVIEADLFNRRYAEMEHDSGQPVPVAAPMMRLSASPEMAMEVGGFAPAPVSADDGDSFSRFTLSEPVTVAAGEIISLPFLAQTIPDARLSLFRGGSGARHPVIALELENPLPLRLPAGILTLYEAGRGHAGDARMPELAPGATETVHFATDTAITIIEESSEDQRVASMRIVDGVLEVTEDLQRMVRYRLQGAALGSDLITLDHPRRAGWQIDSALAAESRADAWRFRIDLPEGETRVLEVNERQPRLRRIGLIDMDLPTLAFWEGQSIDAGTRTLLRELASLRAEQAEARRALDTGIRAASALEQEQRRLVDLIVQLGDENTAPGSRRARVDAIDGELDAMAAQKQALEAAMTDLDRRIRALVRG
jgi:hypothetical protein